jgi:hypothetical protein
MGVRIKSFIIKLFNYLRIKGYFLMQREIPVICWFVVAMQI